MNPRRGSYCATDLAPAPVVRTFVKAADLQLETLLQLYSVCLAVSLRSGSAGRFLFTDRCSGRGASVL